MAYTVGFNFLGLVTFVLKWIEDLPCKKGTHCPRRDGGGMLCGFGVCDHARTRDLASEEWVLDVVSRTAMLVLSKACVTLPFFFFFLRNKSRTSWTISKESKT